MCGIAGFTNFSQETFDIRLVIKNMTKVLYRRGPDGEGFYVKDDIALGHRRLSIIDISAGKQPMSTEDGRYTIVFNGEIYNYLDLKKELVGKGYKFKTKSDTEILLYMFSEYGSSCLPKLNGMFAFAIWDSLKKELFLARDRVGKKPLYYTKIGKDLIFASELKSLVLYPNFDKTLNSESLFEYFYFGYFPCPKSVFKNTYKLKPGHYLNFKNGNISVDKYWNYADVKVDKEINSLSFKEASEYFENLLTDSIKLRILASDVPVGVSLSGGVDSSLVSALATKALGKIQTYSIYFQEKEFDESPYIKQVVEKIGSEHHCEIVTAKKMLDLIPSIPEILDEPMADSSIIPTTFVNQIASKNVKVMLGGDGSDELFCGYTAYSAYKIHMMLGKLPFGFRKIFPLGVNILKTIRVLAPQALKFFIDKVSNKLEKAGSPKEEFLISLMNIIPKKYILSLLKGSKLEIGKPKGGFNSLNSAVDAHLSFYLLNDILVKIDRASMYNSLELRAPFLDFRVVDFAKSLHDSFKINGFERKYIIKKIAEKYLPKEVLYRRKMGFAVPLANWLSNELSPITGELSENFHPALAHHFDLDVMRNIISEHSSRVSDHSNLIWALIVLNKWACCYL